MRLSADVGGTFTDLVVETKEGVFQLFKAPTTPHDPVIGVLNAVDRAAAAFGATREAFLRGVDMFIHATTRSTNAVLTNATARTALLTTVGHPDILVYREGGRNEPFNYSIPYPEPLIPRSLTFEIPERIGQRGDVIIPLVESEIPALLVSVKEKRVEAIGVCLLWSIVNPAHELRLGELIERHLPGVPFTLSHQLNPSLREYRRASSTCIDASLKPLMTNYLATLQARLCVAGFKGRLLTVTSQGSVVDAAFMAEAPIHSVKSGPAMAPIAGRYYAQADAASDIAIVADTGGTSYDVTLVPRGAIPWTRETWLGERLRGHMTGFPSVDVKSIGAGGGSVAWVDEGGMLHVGPQSAGSTPGPVCYGNGGSEPTVTDAALVLGYLDPDYFLGGAIRLDLAAAAAAIRNRVGEPLGLGLHEAANAIVELATESMIHAIEEITVNQGIDPSLAVLIGGGGAAGFNAVRIARRLGCRQVIIPAVGATLSAAGGLMSELSTEYATTCFTTSAAFDFVAVNAALDELHARCKAFIEGPGAASPDSTIRLFAEARYPHQIWEVDVPLTIRRFETASDVAGLVEALHATHEELFSFRDAGSEIEVLTWRTKVSCRIPQPNKIQVADGGEAGFRNRQARSSFFGSGEVGTTVRHIGSMQPSETVVGPAIIESDFTTVVIDPGAIAERMASGSLAIRLSQEGEGA
jgi:N-methylhydantoinase A